LQILAISSHYHASSFKFAAMRIAVNTRFLLKNNLEGYGYYIHELMQRITQTHTQHEFLFVFDRPFDAAFIYGKNVTAKVLKPTARHALSFKIWYDIQFTLAAKKFKAHVMVSLDGFCSLTTSIPQVLAVHDLAFIHHPKLIPFWHLWYYKLYQKKFIQKAAQLVTVSEFSKQDIIHQYKINSNKIHIVGNAPRKNFVPINSANKEYAKKHYAEGCEYFLFVGGIHPRKNLLQLLKAFSLFKKRQLSSMKLLVAGKLAWQYSDIIERLKTYKYRDDVFLLDYLPEGELAKVTAAAYALIFPSVFEGFGVPIIEAMQSGVPVACSNTSSMPEVAGNAALFFDPLNETDIAQQMMLLYKDETLRTQLIEQGFENAKQYSWNTSAQQLWQIIEQTATI
jgi:glycosyltransferase involved in cell wall biosynthesis